MKKLVRRCARGLYKATETIQRNRKPLLAAAVFAAGASFCQAQTDMASTITAVTGYWNSVETVAIGILLFVVGRRVVKKLS